MREEVQQSQRRDGKVVTTDTTRIVDHEGSVSNQASDQYAEDGSTVATRVIWYIAGVLLVLLAFRFVLILLGADQANGFVRLIYSVSYPFALPFFGIFGYSIHYGVSRFEASTLVAMVVYALIAFAIAKLITIRQPRTSS